MKMITNFLYNFIKSDIAKSKNLVLFTTSYSKSYFKDLIGPAMLVLFDVNCPL